MRNRIVFRGIQLAFASAAVLLCAVSATAADSPLALEERQSRQLAIRILKGLQPLEAWVLTAPSSSTTTGEGTRFVEVTGQRVNLRAGPSTDAEVLATGLKGDIFEYISTDGGWFLIRLNDGNRAYVSAQFSLLSSPDGGGAAPPPTRESIDPKYEVRARQILGSNKDAVATLKTLAGKSQEKFDRRYKGKKIAEGDEEFWAASESMLKIRKYESGVSGQFDRFVRMVGGELIAVRPSESKGPAVGLENFRGTVSAGFGSNTAESKQGGTQISKADVTRHDLAADLSADLTPNDRIGVSLGRSEEIQFAEIARTRLGAEYQRKLGDRAGVATRVGLSKYEDKNNNTADLDQTEFSVQGHAKITESIEANANAALAGSSYPNNSNLDYQDTRFGAGLRGRAGDRGRWGLRVTSQKHDVDLSSSQADNTQTNLEGILSLARGERSSVDLTGSLENYSFDQDNDPRTYTRRGLELALRNRGTPGNAGSASLELRQKTYDINDDRDYTEIRGEIRTRSQTDGGRRSSSSLWANYRNYSGKGSPAFLDYLEARLEQSREPGNGLFYESSLYGQYFLESNKIKRDALVTQFLWLGLVVGEDGAFKIGPHVATNTILVIADRPPGQDLGVFEHPNNTARLGAKAAVNVRRPPLTVRGRGRYEVIKYYNVDNSATPSRLELEGEGNYQISPRVAASLKLKMFSTGSDDPGAIETGEFDILFGLIYQIGGRR